MLRWETLDSNRDMPRSPIPPPTRLRLYGFKKSFRKQPAPALVFFSRPRADLGTRPSDEGEDGKSTKIESYARYAVPTAELADYLAHRAVGEAVLPGCRLPLSPSRKRMQLSRNCISAVASGSRGLFPASVGGRGTAAAHAAAARRRDSPRAPAARQPRRGYRCCGAMRVDCREPTPPPPLRALPASSFCSRI